MVKRTKRFLRPLNIEQVLEWARAYRDAHGRWPSAYSGPVDDAPEYDWRYIHDRVRRGGRGLPEGMPLYRLLRPEPVPSRQKGGATLTEEQILAWADAYHEAHGRLPTAESGRVDSAPYESWANLNVLLRSGGRGLPGGSSLSRLLKARRPDKRRELTLKAILAWADAHHAATGEWPTLRSGRVRGARSTLIWDTVDAMLRKGSGNLPGGKSLSQVLLEHRQVTPSRSCVESRASMEKPSRLPLRIEQILAWADAHHAATGRWPRSDNTPIPGVPGETWRRIHRSLSRGCRGVPGKTSLPRLLFELRGLRTKRQLPDLTIEQVLSWADKYHEANGSWPDTMSGQVAGPPPRPTWGSLDRMLRRGERGLPGGSSLDRLLAEHRGVPARPPRPNLTVEQILVWADAYHAATNQWPTWKSGPVEGAPGEDWRRIANALSQGERGLPWRSSLARLLEQRRPPGRGGFTPKTALALLSPAQPADRFNKK